MPPDERTAVVLERIEGELRELRQSVSHVERLFEQEIKASVAEGNQRTELLKIYVDANAQSIKAVAETQRQHDDRLSSLEHSRTRLYGVAAGSSLGASVLTTLLLYATGALAG